MANLKDRVKLMKNHSENGEDHKLMIMDSILGNTDRHIGNVLIHPKGHLVNIDNDLAFSHFNDGMPSYIGQPEDSHEEAGNTTELHPEAAKWISGIDPKHLVGRMLDQGHNPSDVKAAAAGLKMWQKLASQKTMVPLNINQMRDHAVSQMTAVRAAATPKVAPVQQRKVV
jgi:hypothetical protein